MGNYNFWLYQDDAIAGGKTVPETNDKGADSRYARDPVTGAAWTKPAWATAPPRNSYASLYPANYPCNNQPYNADLPALGSNATNYYDPERLGRRRQRSLGGAPHRSGHRQPLHVVQDRPAIHRRQPDYSVTISVKYFDIGADTWSLRYDSASGVRGARLAGTITKTNTKQLKVATFNISDGKFAKRLASNQADFVIDSNNDGNEWIHMVDVAKKAAFDPPTPTPTRRTPRPLRRRRAPPLRRRPRPAWSKATPSGIRTGTA